MGFDITQNLLNPVYNIIIKFKPNIHLNNLTFSRSKR